MTTLQDGNPTYLQLQMMSSRILSTSNSSVKLLNVSREFGCQTEVEEPVFCAGGHGPRLASFVRIRLCFIRLSPPSRSVPERVWCLALILPGSEACGWSLPACLPCLMHSLVFPPWVGPLRLGRPPRVLLEGKRSLLCL